MSHRHGRDNDSMAAAIFAVTFVIIGGLGICSAVTLTFSPDPRFGVIVIGICFFFLTMFIVRIVTGGNDNKAANRSSYWILGKGKSRKEDEYVPEVRRKSGDYQKPPSAESVRTLKDGTNNWVPSGTSGKPQKR